MSLNAYNLIATIGSFVLSLGVVLHHRQRICLGQARRARAATIRGTAETLRVVRDLAPSAPQLRRRPGRSQRRAAARYPRGCAPP
mgnify:CR=1 FL=1